MRKRPKNQGQIRAKVSDLGDRPVPLSGLLELLFARKQVQGPDFFSVQLIMTLKFFVLRWCSRMSVWFSVRHSAGCRFQACGVSLFRSDTLLCLMPSVPTLDPDGRHLQLDDALLKDFVLLNRYDWNLIISVRELQRLWCRGKRPAVDGDVASGDNS